MDTKPGRHPKRAARGGELEVATLGALADPTHAALVAKLLDTYGFGWV